MLHKLFCALMSSDSMYDKCMISVITCDPARNVCIQFRGSLTDWCGPRTDSTTLFYFYVCFFSVF